MSKSSQQPKSLNNDNAGFACGFEELEFANCFKKLFSVKNREKML